MKNPTINLSKLKKGNKILLETKECVFDIKIVTPSTGRVYIVGGKRFTLPTLVKIIGSYGTHSEEIADGLILVNQIEQGVGFQISYKDNDDIVIDFITSPVISAKVYDKDWEFEVWDDANRRAKLSQSLQEARTRLRMQTNEDSNS